MQSQAPQPAPVEYPTPTPPFGLKPQRPWVNVIWTIAGVLAVLVVAATVLWRVGAGRTNRLLDQVQQAEERLAALQTPEPTAAAFATQLDQSQRALALAQLLQPTLAARRDWQQVYDALLTHDSSRVTLRELSQAGDTITVKGLALTEEDALAYAAALSRTGVFAEVPTPAMQRIANPLLTPLASATPGGTPAAGPTPTPDPSHYDEYEIGAPEPRAIYVGQTQRHNFYPVYDVDQVTFLGKAGFRYCILALPQAIGVDTYLEVSVGGTGYVNDDCFPTQQSLASCQCPSPVEGAGAAALVELQVPAGADQQVLVRVSNRGQFGAAAWYTLLIQETTGDPWERDDEQPKPISVGEQQVRTFYPVGDVDQVSLSMQAGRAYEVRTSALSAGVDTVLTVLANGLTFANDDVAAGDRSSRVTLTAAANGTATIRVTNKGVYGANLGYALRVVEVGGDLYEPDDYTPKALAPGEQQRHTFFPDGDVDRVQFSVLAARTYEVQTYGLAVGVDTVLSVLVQGHFYLNDDVTPGDPSSRVLFTAPANTVAGVSVTSRGLYGTDKAYWLTLREVTVAATPSVTRTATVTTPTPDCGAGDTLEPDDAVGRIVAVSQDYMRAFCPAGDVDRGVFTAKAGYAYVIETYGLAPGVDTYVSVQCAGVTWTNDDRTPQDLSSRVLMQNATGADTPAFITIVNKAQYGVGRTYLFKVSNAGAGDTYEVDDVSGVPIVLGGTQSRTFYPPADIDKVFFTAKANHRYRIYTTIPTPGPGSVVVDTVLRVDMGATHLVNDDRVPGDLSSYVELQNFSVADSQAWVTVTNEGQYSISAGYTLAVEDLGAYSGDEYEPDLTAKRYISINEVQQHTFFPEDDIDRLFLTVKAGRSYRVTTCGAVTAPPVPTPTPTGCAPLAPGVDTVLVVAGPITNCAPPGCQNDDTVPGAGDLGSQVSFDAVTDGEVTITIYNRGLFGPAMTYSVRVEETGLVPPTPVTPSATPTRTATPTNTNTPAPTATVTVTSSPTDTPTATPTATDTATATPTATVTDTPTPTPTATTSGVSMPAGEARSGAEHFQRILALPSNASLGSATHRAQLTDQQVVEFVLVLRLRPVTP